MITHALDMPDSPHQWFALANGDFSGDIEIVCKIANPETR